MTIILKRSPMALVIRLVLLLFLLDTAYALLILAFLYFAAGSPYYASFVIFLWAIHTAKYIIITYLLVRILIEWLETTYVLDGKRLTVTSGMYSFHERVYLLGRGQEFDIHQDWLGRLFHYGVIKFELSGIGARESLEIKDIEDPKQLKTLLTETLL